jgi:hypothetical protein
MDCKANPGQANPANPDTQTSSHLRWVMQGKPRHTDFFTPAVGDACENPWKTQTHRFWGAAEGKPKANPRQTHKANPEEGKPRHTDFFTPAVGDACGGTDLTVGRERGRLFQETG